MRVWKSQAPFASRSHHPEGFCRASRLKTCWVRARPNEAPGLSTIPLGQVLLQAVQDPGKLHDKAYVACSGERVPGFRALLPHSLADTHWEIYSTSLWLSFLICKTGLIMVPASFCLLRELNVFIGRDSLGIWLADPESW